MFILFIVLAQLAGDSLGRADTAVRGAFAFLYAMPRDTAGADMGEWVLDTEATTSAPDPSGTWRIVVTQLVDTGNALDLSELVGPPGTSPAELAAAAAAMQKLEGKISKAEAESSLDITVTLGSPATMPPVTDSAPTTRPSVPGALATRRVAGHFTRVLDRELGIEYERWSTATLYVQFGNVAVAAEGNEQMIDRVIKQTRWDLLAAIR